MEKKSGKSLAKGETGSIKKRADGSSNLAPVLATRSFEKGTVPLQQSSFR